MNKIKSYILEAVILGLIWGLITYYVRRTLNSGNYGEERKKIVSKQLSGHGSRDDFFGDSFYGGIAAGLIFFSSKIIRNYVRKFI